MDLNIYSPLPRRKDFRIGVLGSGFVVNECHLPAYAKAGFNVVAIASRNRANAEKTAARHHIPKVHESYEVLLDDASIEVLDIAVPPQALKELVLKACKRKTVKGILAQKPLGVNYEQAEEIVAACEAAGITLAVNQNMRFEHSVRAAKTLLENGTIGEPVLATIDMRGIPHWQPWQAELGWATLRIMSIHHLDTFRYWFGEPERIFCSTRTDPRTKFAHRDGICTYILEYANGLRCVAIDDPWTGPAKEGCPPDIGIKWRIEGLNGLAMGDIGWCKEPFTTPSTIRYAAKGDKEFHAPTWAESWFPDAFIGTMADLLVALEEGKSPSISGRDNLETMQLVDAAYVSAHVHEAVKPQEVKTPNPPAKWKWWKKFAPSLTKPVAPPSLYKSRDADGVSNFTPHAQRVLALSRREAERLNHNFVGTEHILLGIIALGNGSGAEALHNLGLDIETLRSEVESLVGMGPDQKMIGNIPYTPRVKKVLALATTEAKEQNHPLVGTGHILLGLLREGDGVAARILKKLDVTLEQLRAKVLRLYAAEQTAGMVSAEQSLAPSTAAPSFNPPTEMNLTPRAQQVLRLARTAAQDHHDNFVGTEHVLIGLIMLGQGVAVSVLHKLGLNLDNVRREIEENIYKRVDRPSSSDMSYTSRTKKVLALAAQQAQALNHTYVGTEHILLGLLEEGTGVAAQTMVKMGVDIKETRKAILRELDPNFGAE